MQEKITEITKNLSNEDIKTLLEDIILIANEKNNTSTLLTKQDLAKRWQMSVKTIERYREDKIITPCRGIPAIRFTSQHIAELEGVKLEKFSPLERRKLERELEGLRRENEKLKGIISTVVAATSQAITFQDGQA